MSLFSPDFKAEPYWWDGVRPVDLRDAPLPPAVDVVVVGSGYTGLNAALQTARGGRSTLVVDAEMAGWGCSTRNGGQISTSIKPDLDQLSARYGRDRAVAILREGRAALAWIEQFVRDEAIACEFRVPGRFHAAHNARAYERLARALDEELPEFATGGIAVPRAEQRRAIGSDAYHGGVVYPHHASLDPARYHAGLLERVLAAGASVVAHCPVEGIHRQRDGFEVVTARGRVRARNVVVATNGYTGAMTPWLRRRVIPIGSYIIATEPVGTERMARIIPGDRVVSDTRKLVYYYRASPDGTRMLFGGRVSATETDPRVSGPLLHREMARLFPDLAAARVTHSWAGTVAYTFDTLAHVGEHEGMHFALGYCGSGVSMASYFGMRLGLKVLGRPEGRTAFDGLPFPTRPLYTGRPWFLGASIAYFRMRDQLPV